MRNIPNKVDGVGDKLSGGEYSAHKNEAQNTVLSADLSLDSASGPDTDLDMLSRAIAVYSMAGQFYDENGAGANDYELIRPNNLKKIVAYVDGMIVAFKVDQNNTGALTINVEGKTGLLGAKSFVKFDGSAFATGEILNNQFITAVYLQSIDKFEMLNTDNSNWMGEDLAVINGGTGASDAATARTNLSAAESGANSDITSLMGVTVNGSLRVGNSSTEGNLSITENTSKIGILSIRSAAGALGIAGIKFSSNPTVNRAKAAFYFVETNNGAHHTGDFVFALNSTPGDAFEVTAANEVMRIQNNGDVAMAGALTLATPLSVSQGGSAATTAPTARTNLGAAKNGANSDITSLTAVTINGDLTVAIGSEVNTTRVRALDTGGLDLVDVNNVKGIHVSTGGNVGIGTSTTPATLTLLKDSTIGVNTSNLTDDGSLKLSGGGSYGSSRGAYIKLHGNEVSANAGDLYIGAGNSGGSDTITLFAGPAAQMSILGDGSIHMWNINTGTGNDMLYNIGTSEILYITSSKQFKKDVVDLEFNSDNILKLRPVSFTWNEKTVSEGQRDFGLIAEEVDKIVPQMVQYDKKGKPLSVNYKMLSVIILDKLKKEEKHIQKLEKSIEELLKK